MSVIKDKGGWLMPKISVYTSNGWGPCLATKLWLKDRDYEFEEYNVSEDKSSADMLLRLGARVTPVVMVDEQMIVGYSPTQLQKALS